MIVYVQLFWSQCCVKDVSSISYLEIEGSHPWEGVLSVAEVTRQILTYIIRASCKLNIFANDLMKHIFPLFIFLNGDCVQPNLFSVDSPINSLKSSLSVIIRFTCYIPYWASEAKLDII